MTPDDHTKIKIELDRLQKLEARDRLAPIHLPQEHGDKILKLLDFAVRQGGLDAAELALEPAKEISDQIKALDAEAANKQQSSAKGA